MNVSAYTEAYQVRACVPTENAQAHRMNHEHMFSSIKGDSCEAMRSPIEVRVICHEAGVCDSTYSHTHRGIS